MLYWMCSTLWKLYIDDIELIRVILPLKQNFQRVRGGHRSQVSEGLRKSVREKH